MSGNQQETGRECASCGFVCKQAWSPRGAEYYEIPLEDRTAEEMQQVNVMVSGGRYNPHSFKIVCFRQAADLETEIKQSIEKSGSLHTARLAVLNQKRKCNAWFRHVPAFSPKEHLVEQRVEQSEQRAAELMNQLEASRREHSAREGRINRRYTSITIGIGLCVVLLNFMNRGSPIEHTHPIILPAESD
jgi:hypothetical protein